MKSHILTACIAALSGAAAVRYLTPARIEYRDRVRTVTVRETTRAKQRTVRKPDGTVITERTDTQVHSDTDRRAETSKITTTTPRPWHAGALLMLTPTRSAGVLVQRDLGPFTVGALATVPTAQPLSVPAVGVTVGVRW